MAQQLAAITRSRTQASYRQLMVWQLGLDLVQEIYELTRRFPSEERFGLTLQLRRAAISVPSNIAEGNERQSRRDHQRFLTVARASLAEIDTQLEVAQRLGYVNAPALATIDELIDHLNRGLYRLRLNAPR